jgi:hypothetical protein
MSITEQVPSSASPDGTPVQTKQYFLVLFQAGFRDDPLGTLDRFVLQDIQEKLDRVVVAQRHETEIDVWLESPGGDAHVAYKLFLEMRSRARIFRVVIPDYAKSAATLFAIGADELWMAPAAELGPLDAQLEHPDREGVTVSALDVANALGFLTETAIKYLVVGGGQVLKSTGLPRVDVLEQFAKFAAAFFQPIIAKLDPHLIHQAANELGVAQRYAANMLRLRRIGNGDRDDVHPRQLAQCLVEHYPSHAFVISREAIAKFGLSVQNAEAYNYWTRVKALFAAYREGKFLKDTESSCENHLIDVWSLDDFERFFADMESGDADEGKEEGSRHEQENGDETQRDAPDSSG